MDTADPILNGIRLGGVDREKAFAELRAQLQRIMAAKLKASYQVDDTFVEDIIQETLLTVLEKLNSFRGDSAFITWVCSIAVRHALAEIRKKRWKDYSLDTLTEDSFFEPADTRGDFTENVAAAEMLSIVKESIRSALTDKQRTALLAEVDGMTTDEISRRFQTTRGAIYKLTYDARRSLVKHLKKKGIDMEADYGRKA